ncbi:type VI secretion system tube protein TssD [Spirosoma gilvum]
MAYDATLNVDGNAFRINWLLLRVGRKEDQRGRPASRPGWSVVISLDAMDDTTVKNWMIDPNMQKDGKIILSRIDEDATFKEIEFKKAHCTGYEDEFFSDRDYMHTVINITGGELTINKSTLRV